MQNGIVTWEIFWWFLTELNKEQSTYGSTHEVNSVAGEGRVSGGVWGRG